MFAWIQSKSLSCPIPANALFYSRYDPNALSLSIRDLRKEIALVSQMPVLFSSSIFDNIAAGKDNATRAEVIQAAKLVCAMLILDSPIIFRPMRMTLSCRFPTAMILSSATGQFHCAV
jgi:hypothetical protein